MLERLLRLIDEEQVKFARDALLRPQGQSAFDYGHAVGRYAGIERVKELIDELLEDRNPRDNDI